MNVIVGDTFILPNDGSEWIIEYLDVHNQITLFRKERDNFIWIGTEDQLKEQFLKLRRQ